MVQYSEFCFENKWLIKRPISRTGEMDQLIRCLPHKHKDLRVDPQHPSDI